MRIALLKGNRYNPWHLQAYKRLRGDVEVVAFRAESEIQRRMESCDDGSASFPVEPLYFDTQAGPLPRRFWNTFAARYFNREARLVPFSERLRGFDILHTWELFTDWSAEAAKAKRAYGMPLCVMVWDNIAFNMEQDPDRRAIKKNVISDGDLFIVHSERSRRVLEIEGVPAQKIVTMDVGLDTERFTPGVGSRDALGLPGDAFVILFVGWLLPRKGLDFLLLAFRELLQDDALCRVQPHLVILGSGPGQARIDALIDRLGVRASCSFIPSLPYDRMPDLYRCADVFVLPSIATPDWQEQFGMSIIEALSCGVPVVTTWSGAIPEIVEDAAILCQPNDFVSLHAALKVLMTIPERRAELAHRGRELAGRRFRLQPFADHLSEVYDRLLTGA